jgi:hypothetical protein
MWWTGEPEHEPELTAPDWAALAAAAPEPEPAPAPVDLDEATAAMPAVPAQRRPPEGDPSPAPLFAPQRPVQRPERVPGQRAAQPLAAPPALDPWALPVPDYTTAGDYRDARTALGWSVARAHEARDAALDARALAEEARAVAARTELKVDEPRARLDGLVAAVGSAQTPGSSSAAGSPDPVGIGATPAPAVGRGQALVDVELLAEHLADVVADAIARRMNGECCG